MRVVVAAIALLMLVPTPVNAADGRDVFTGILQGLAGEIDRQQQRKAEKRAQQLFNRLFPACAGGDVGACDSILEIPNLTPDTRETIWQQRQFHATQKQEQQAAFTANWNTCQRLTDVTACDAALAFSGLVEADRSKLVIWRSEAEARGRIAAERAAQELREQREAEVRAARNAMWQQAIAEQQAAQARKEAETARAVAAQEKAAEQQRLRKESDQQRIMLLVVMAVGMLVMAGLAVQGFRTMPPRSPPIAPLVSESPPATVQEHSDATVPRFLPLTGHFPTDIRNALQEMSGNEGVAHG